MIKATKEYFGEVVVPSAKWLKRHWKGFLGIYAIIYALTVGWLLRDDIIYKIEEIIDGIKDKFSRKEES